MNRFDRSRRQFLRTASLTSMAGLSVSPFLLELNSLAAMAQSSGATDYRALVCVFLQGGNDGHGTVIATIGFVQCLYASALGSSRACLSAKRTAADYFANAAERTHVCAESEPWRSAKSIQCRPRRSCGEYRKRLIAPSTKAQINANSVPLPASLFSHFDQTAAWQAIASNGGSAEHEGWGGAVADMIESMNMNSNSMFTCISTAGIALFLSGQTSFQLNVTSAGPIPIYGLSQPLFGQSAGTNALTSILTADETNLFAKEYEVVVNRSTDAQALLASSMLTAGPTGIPDPPQFLDPITNKLTDNQLAISLQTVARIIGGKSSLGVTRQIFYVQLGSFDTHDGQAVQHARLLTHLGQALEYFDGSMTTVGIGNQVTTFTASDFGRTFTCNSDGTDHGWGSHHFVVGGAVQGE